MKRGLLLMTLSGLFLPLSSSFGEETNLLVTLGAPTNAVVACPNLDAHGVSSDDLAEALGVYHWSFLAQTPDMVDGTMVLSWVGKETNDLTYFELSSTHFNPQTGQHIPGAYHHRILLMIFPIDNSTDDAWRNSAMMRVYVKDSDAGMLTWATVKNPFKGFKGGWTQNYGPPAVDGERSSTGQRKVMGTKFDIIRGTEEKGMPETSLRISFIPGMPTRRPHK